MEHVVLPGHLLDHSYSLCCRREPQGLTEQAPSNAPESPQALGLAPEPGRVSRRTLALKRKATLVQVPTSESSVPVQACPSPAQPSSSPPAPGSPLRIHGLTVEEYQSVYHSVVDPMLTFSNGWPRKYTLALGRKIKQRLWEELNRPLLTEMETAGGLLHYVQSCSTGPSPPLIDVDISKEPPPPERSCLFQAQPTVSAEGRPRRKRTRPDQTTVSSPVPEEEEPRSKRQCHPAAEPEHPLSSRSIVLKFTQQDAHSRKPVYAVEDVSEQVAPSSTQTSASAPYFLQGLGLAQKGPASDSFSPQPLLPRDISSTKHAPSVSF